jgi:hypothetical protein
VPFFSPAPGIAVRPLVAVNGGPTALRPFGPSSGFATNMLAVVMVGLGPGFFVWDALSTAADDGATVIKPNDVAPGAPGRWVLMSGGSSMAAEAFVFRLEGDYSGAILDGSFDGPMLVISARTIARVWLLRRTAGSAGTTRVAVLVNGANIFPAPVNEPQVTSSMGDYAIASSTTFVPGSASLVQNDTIEVILRDKEDASAAGPEGLCVVIEFAP